LFDGDYDNLTNKPTLFSENYNDLINKPNIPSNISDLNDVSTSNPSAGQVLKWTGTNWAPADDATSGGGGLDADTLDGQDSSYFLDWINFINKPTLFSGNYSDLTNKPNIPSIISDLTDVSINNPQNETFLMYDGSVWTDSSVPWSAVTNRPTTLIGYGISDAFDGDYNNLSNRPSIPNNLSDLNNVDGIPQQGNVLKYTANNTWEPQVASGETLTSLTLVGNELRYVDENGTTTVIERDGAKTTSASLSNGVLTLQRNDNSTYAVDLAPLEYKQLMGLEDTTIGLPPSIGFGDVLTWTANNSWEPQQATGGGANVTISDQPPSSPNDGDLWWESDSGKLKIWYDDGTSTQWVDASPVYGSVDLNVLTDVDTTTNTPAISDVLTWTANNTWEPQQVTGGGGGGSITLLDEDNFASNSDTQAPTQQSVKAYVDSMTIGSLDDVDASASSSPTHLDILTWYETTNNFGVVSGEWKPLDLANVGFVLITRTTVDNHLNKSSATSGQVLSWNGSDYDWVTQSSSVSVLNDLTDVNPGVSVANYHYLRYNSSSNSWDNDALELDSTHFDNIIGTPTDGQVLTWNSSGSYWEPTNAAGGGATTLAGLTDVVISNPSWNHFLYWNGTAGEWENDELNWSQIANKPNFPITSYTSPNISDVLTFTANNVWEPQLASSGGGGGSSSLAGLTDTSVSNPTDGHVLTWNSIASYWEPKNSLGTDPSGFDTLRSLYSSTIKEIVVTVTTKTTAHRYSGVGSNSMYLLDGAVSPYLTLTPGRTYRFKQDDSSNSSHQLRFYHDPTKTKEFTGTNVTYNGTAGSSGSYSQIEVDYLTPAVLYYQCVNHSFMGNALNAQSGIPSSLKGSSINDLDDTTITSVQSNDVLTWDGSVWKNSQPSSGGGGGGSSTLGGLTDTGGSVSSPSLNDVLIFTANNTWDNYPMHWDYISSKPVIVDPEGTPSSTGPAQWTYNANSAYDISTGPQNYIFSVFNDNGYTWDGYDTPSYTFLFKLANSTPQWIQDYLSVWPVDHKFTIVIRNTFHVSQHGSGVPNGVHFECHAKLKEFSWGSSQVNRYIKFDPTESYSQFNMIDWMNGGAWGAHDFWLEIYDGWGETSGAPYLNRLAMDFKTSTLTPNTSDVLTWTANNTWEPQVAESVSDANFWKKQASKTFNLLPQGTGGGTGYYWRLEYGGAGNTDGYVSSGPLDDDTNPDLYVTPGETICFKLDNSTVNGSIQPVHIRTNASTSAAGTNFNEHLVHYDDSTGIYSEGSSAQGKTTGYLYWTVPYSIGTNYGSSSYGSTTYHYQSGSDNSFTGKFVIRDTPSFDSGITPSSNDVLTWTANNTWEPQQATGGGGSSSQITSTTGSNTVHLTANTTSNRFDYNAHFIPTSNASYDLGNAEYKVRHLFLSDNSLWIGDDHKMSVEGGKVKYKKRKKSVWPKSITTHVGWGPGASLENTSAISWINTTFSKTYTEVSELNLKELLSVLEYLNGNWTSLEAELITTVNDLFPPESDSGNYSHDDYDEIFSNEQEGRRMADPKGNLNTLEINLSGTRSYFLEQSPNYDPEGDLTVNFHGAAPVPGATLDFTIFIQNGGHPKNISSINVNGVAASQVRTSGIDVASYPMQMCTYTIKGVCDSSLNWLLTIHVA
jgi:hypothetical protein